MNFDIACSIIESELSADDDTDTVTIEFFGGEPLLCFDLIKRICSWTWSKKWNKEYVFFATTNGTLLPGDVKDWFSENRNRFWLGLSYDGDESMQEINRPGSSKAVDLDFFRECWPDQGVKMTISKETLPFLADGVIFLHEKNIKVTCNLAFGIGWDGDKFKDLLSRQLQILADYYVEHPEIHPCSMLDYKIEGVLYGSDEFGKWCGAGTHMHFYSIDGDCYPCQFFQPLSIGDSLSEKSSVIDFDDCASLLAPMCDGCAFIPICPTCYGANFAMTGDASNKSKDECILNQITILANSYLRFKLLDRWPDDVLGILPEDRRELLEASVAIQEAWVSMNQ